MCPIKLLERQVGGKAETNSKYKRVTLRKKRSLVDLTSPSPPSIPSKFESRDITQYNVPKENTAFGCSTTRFDDSKDFNSQPGPGQYHKQSSLVKDSRSTCGSISKKGFTSLVSLEPRFNTDLKDLQSKLTPGPGSYDPSLNAIKTCAPKINFSSRGTKRNEKSSSISRANDDDAVTPGPGQYNVQAHLPSKLGSSSFKFTARKDSDFIIQPQTQAAVGTYNPEKSLAYFESLGMRNNFPDPIFSSTSSRFAHSKTYTDTPGPGYYCSDDLSNYSLFYRPSACFHTNLDRFGNSCIHRIQRQENPGPGSYFPCFNDNDDKGAVASFASTCDRFEPEYGRDGPGPGKVMYIYYFAHERFL